MTEAPKKILIIRASPVAPDTRLERVVGTLAPKYKIYILAWDKKGEHSKHEDRPNCQVFRCKGKTYKNPFFTRLLNFISWIIFINKWLIREKFDIIHACDFDTYFLSFFISKLRRKKIVYDIFDFYSEMMYNSPKIITSIIKHIDLFLMKFAYLVIIADDSRIEQIKGERLKNLISIYNSPPDYLEKFKQDFGNTVNDKVVITYLGLIENKKRDLLFAIEALKNKSEFIFNIYGAGKDFKLIEDTVKNIQNINIYKSIPYLKALEVGYLSDIIISIYNPQITNNIYASPNKVFESMMLSKPILINEEIKFSKIVLENNCGTVYKYGSPNSLFDACKKMTKNKDLFKQMGENARKLYDQKYSSKKNDELLLKSYPR